MNSLLIDSERNTATMTKEQTKSPNPPNSLDINLENTTWRKQFNKDNKAETPSPVKSPGKNQYFSSGWYLSLIESLFFNLRNSLFDIVYQDSSYLMHFFLQWVKRYQMLTMKMKWLWEGPTASRLTKSEFNVFVTFECFFPWQNE